MNVEEILTPQEMAARLKVPVSWVYEQTRTRGRLRNSDPLPHRKMGRYLRFILSEVLEWLERQNGNRTAAVNSPTGRSRV
jgi:excisionase family DNA binding protein